MSPAGRRLPPLNALRAFEAAARHLSFKAAARELHVTQAAISHQVRALEEHLGARLFVRLHRALRLTAPGARYLPALREAFDRIDEATLGLRGGARRRALTLSVVPSFGSRWLVPRLGEFQRLHPDVDLVVLASAALVDFTRDAVDVGIRFGAGRYPGLRADLILDEEILPVASPKLARGRHPLRRPEDLRHHTLLHDDTHDPWRAWLAAAGVTGVDPERGVVFSDSTQLVAAAVAGQGVALARRLLAGPDLRAGRLVRVFGRRAHSDFAYWLVTPEARAHEPLIRSFRDWVLAAARKRR